VKGGGAAHTREKAIAMQSEYWACVVDATKITRSLGGLPIPLEVEAPAIGQVRHAVAGLGGVAMQREGVLTDDGNPILDVSGLTVFDPLALEAALEAIPGVIGCGLFAKRRADVILVGRSSGSVGRIVPHGIDEEDDD
jgi:ribose 5-phosphate isomerase A